MLCILNIQIIPYNDVFEHILESIAVLCKMDCLFITDRSTVTRERAMKNQMVMSDPEKLEWNVMRILVFAQAAQVRKDTPA